MYGLDYLKKGLEYQAEECGFASIVNREPWEVLEQGKNVSRFLLWMQLRE